MVALVVATGVVRGLHAAGKSGPVVFLGVVVMRWPRRRIGSRLRLSVALRFSLCGRRRCLGIRVSLRRLAGGRSTWLGLAAVGLGGWCLLHTLRCLRFLRLGLVRLA